MVLLKHSVKTTRPASSGHRLANDRTLIMTPSPPGAPIYCALQATTLLVAVDDNSTVMKAGAGALLGDSGSSERCVTVSSYLEAVGVLAAHKSGVNPACLTTNVPAVREMLPLPEDGAKLQGTASCQDLRAVAE